MSDRCPTCETTLEEHVVRLGGVCPNCFADIVGTATARGSGPRLKRPQRYTLGEMTVAVMVGGGVLGVALFIIGMRMIDTRKANDIRFAVDATEEMTLDFETAQIVVTRPAAEVVAPEDVGGEGDAPAADGPPTNTGNPDADAAVEPDVPSSAPIVNTDAEPAAGAAAGAMVAKRLADYERADVGRCYERVLRSEPDLSGTWDLAFTINTAGTTEDISVSSRADGNARLEACLRNVVKYWAFEPLTAPLDVRKPVALSSEE